MHQASFFRKPAVIASMVLVLSAYASMKVLADEPEPSIELYHEIAGPAIKTWTLRLERNGKVIEERYDLNSKRYHQVDTLCRLGKDDAQRVIDASAKLVDALPSSLGGEQGVRLDGPYKTLRVVDGEEKHSSWWHSPEDANPSMQAQEFAQTWETIRALLSCTGKVAG